MTERCPNCGAPVQPGAATCEYCGGIYRAQPSSPQSSPSPTPALPVKSKTTAAVLALLLGSFGVHKFYLGKKLQGFLMLLFCWTYVPSFIALVDFIILLTSGKEAFMQKYNCRTP